MANPHYLGAIVLGQLSILLCCGCDGTFDIRGTVSTADGIMIPDAKLSFSGSELDCNSVSDSTGNFHAVAVISPRTTAILTTIHVTAEGYVPLKCSLTLSNANPSAAFILEKVEGGDSQ